MNRKLRMVLNGFPKEEDRGRYVEILSQKEVQRARRFVSSFPEYQETPLVNLEGLASRIGVANVYVKDESFRFGLNSFKALGGAWAMGNFLADKLHRNIDELTLEELLKPETKEAIGDVTFYTATDGNQGRAVAWVAQKLGQKSVVYMPEGSSAARLNNILACGSDASITQMNYNDAVRYANEMAQKNNGIIVQDTAWEGYTEVPTHIMQGYGIMALEALEQIRAQNLPEPTHIFLQAGVGSMAGACQGFFASVYQDACPVTIVVEPDEANCYYQSAAQQTLVNISGDMRTIMVGLACGEPNIISFDIMKHWSSAFLSLPDYVSGDGMRVLGNPLPGDTRIVSGESGAPPTGALYHLMTDPELASVRASLGLDEHARVLLFSTEGDTDPDRYRDIVWNGAFSRFD
ncbi:Diaminopropionate ammonia-lyase [Clostridiaceae bacterium JG1575]|nr:Diaminopropionate ammonia-lyase [Clostridiaceae bacterium JG1575]